MRHRKILAYSSSLPVGRPFKCRLPGSREYEMVTIVQGPIAYECETTDGGFGVRMHETRTGIEAAGGDFMAVRASMHRQLRDRAAELADREADGLTEGEADQLAHLREWHRFLST